jgi:hypothetical protein
VSYLELFPEPDKLLVFQWFRIEQLQCNCQLLQNGLILAPHMQILICSTPGPIRGTMPRTHN